MRPLLVLVDPPIGDALIRARYARNGRFIRQAVLEADRGFVYDDSLRNVAPKRRLIFTKGRPTSAHQDLPSWILALYGDLLPQ
jgi:predicted ABC-type ATPase